MTLDLRVAFATHGVGIALAALTAVLIIMIPSGNASDEKRSDTQWRASLENMPAKTLPWKGEKPFQLKAQFTVFGAAGKSMGGTYTKVWLAKHK